MDNDRAIPTILARQACAKHQAQPGDPCFTIVTKESDTYLAGVCDKRARLAGFVGKISDQALRTFSRR